MTSVGRQSSENKFKQFPPTIFVTIHQHAIKTTLTMIIMMIISDYSTQHRKNNLERARLMNYCNDNNETLTANLTQIRGKVLSILIAAKSNSKDKQ